MESKGALENVLSICGNENVGIGMYVSDDDSTQTSILSHHSSTNKKGQLPENIEEPDFRADVNHRVKNVGKPYFGLAYLPADKNLGMDVNLAYRISKALGHVMAKHRQEPAEEFRKKLMNIIEHLFDNHENCGDFCPVRDLSDDEKKARKKCFLKKEKYLDLYNYMVKHFKNTFTDRYLFELNHPYNTNLSEGLNSAVCKACPKTKHYAQSISLFGRLSLIICIHSTGYAATFQDLFRRLGFDIGRLTLEYCRRRDRDRELKRIYHRSREFKKKRAKRRNDRIKQSYSKVWRRNADDYRSNMRVDDRTGAPILKKFRGMRKEQHLCISCGIAGHSNKSSLRCFHAKQYEGNVELWIQTTQHNGEGDVFETPTEEVSLKCTICGHLGHRNNNNLRCRRHAMFAKLGGGRDGEEKGIQLWQDLTACLDAQKSGATEDVSDDTEITEGTFST